MSGRHAAAVCVALLVAGCASEADPPAVVVYTALDADFSRPIFERFTAETGIRVRPKFDTEATKTVGLVNAIVAEKNRPRCDVFWNNEIVGTIRLARAGLLDTYRSPAAAGIPDTFKDPAGRWCGFAARARVLIVNSTLVPAGQAPATLAGLADARWKGRVGMAKPLFGTTATHVACLFATLGQDKAEALLLSLKKNGVRIESGNKQVARRVTAGELAMGLTDTDDAIIEVEGGKPVRIEYLDAGAGQAGTLFIPNTLSIVKDCPHPQAARKLVDYLLSPAVETALARCPSAQIPLNPAVEIKARVKRPSEITAMAVDFAKAADAWDAAARFATEQFTR